MAYRNYSVENGFVVDPSGNGDFKTIATALTASSSGRTIFIRPGTYTENLTLKAGVNLTAFDCDAFTPNVTIAGTCTLTAAGTVSISGIRLQTNSAALLAVTGSNASIVNLINCYLDCTNNTGITFSTSSSSGQININFCSGNLGTTGIGLFAHSSAGAMAITSSFFNNSGGSSTASTCSAGVLNVLKSNFVFPVTMSSTGTMQMEYGSFDCSGQNATALTLGGSSLHYVRYSKFASGSASSISIGGSAVITSCEVTSSNTNAITGAGTITYSAIIFPGSSTTINTTTQTSCGTLQGSKNTAPAAGFLGEIISSAVTNVAAGSSGTATTLTSISLTAGVWDITAFATGVTGSFNFTLGQIGISTTTNTFQGNYGDQNYIANGATAATLGYISGSVPNFRVVINTTTTYYLVTSFTYASGSPTVNGRISGVRVG